MPQLYIDFEAVENIQVPPKVPLRQLRTMHYENLIQGSMLNKELSRQATARRNAEFEENRARLEAWIPADQLAEERADDQLVLILEKFHAGKKLSKSDLAIIDSVFLPGLLRIALTTGLPEEVQHPVSKFSITS